MATFFISYTASDQAWAEWIAWQLEHAGHTTIVQAWDFRPGSNWVLEMHRASQSASATLALLSPEYLAKAFTSSEWAAAFVNDPEGKKRTLIPVRICDVQPPGLLASIVYIDLARISNEQDAVDCLLNGITMARTKPGVAPKFPRSIQNEARRPAFPGTEPVTPQPPTTNAEDMEIEVRIARRFEDFSPAEQDKLVRALRELLALDYDLRVTKISRGSVLMTLRLHKRDALRLYILHRLGKLRRYDISGVEIAGQFSITLDEAFSQLMDSEPLPPIVGETESGTVVFWDDEKGYGVIERDRGGFIKFVRIPPRGGMVALQSTTLEAGSDAPDHRNAPTEDPKKTR